MHWLGIGWAAFEYAVGAANRRCCIVEQWEGRKHCHAARSGNNTACELE